MIQDAIIEECYRRYGNTHTYTILRSIVIDGHQTAWMEEIFHVNEKEIKRQIFACECSLSSGYNCLARETALYLRQLELRKECRERFLSDKVSADLGFGFYPDLAGVIMYLVEKAERGEFLGEDPPASTMLGGYLMIHTVSKIIGVSTNLIWESVELLVRKKKIRLSGMVIMPR